MEEIDVTQQEEQNALPPVEEKMEEKQHDRFQTFIEKYKKFQGAWERGEEKVGAFFRKIQYPLLFVFMTVAAFVLRTLMFDMKSGDYNSFLAKWFDYIKENGGFMALKNKIGDYTPAYFYILAFLTYLPFDSLYSIKVVSCIFDIVLAVSVALCVWELTKDKKIVLTAYVVASLLPTVFLNSGAWAQCDGIYTAFVLLCLYFMMRKKHFTAMIMYGFAFSFKLQAIFFAPLLAVLWLKRKLPRTAPLVALGVYFLTCVPVWIMGRDLGELLLTYLMQAGSYGARLTWNAPTLVALLGTVPSDWIGYMTATFVLLAVVVTVFVMYLCGRFELNNEALADFGMLFVLLVPYLLPRMHERYFYLADILAIVYVSLHRKRWYTLVLTEFCSFLVVVEYLFTLTYFSLEQVALIQGINLILLCKDLWKDYGNRSLNKPLAQFTE